VGQSRLSLQLNLGLPLGSQCHESSEEVTMFRNVLVGVDGRQGGRDAIGLARQLATPETTITLAHVIAPMPGRGASLALPLQRAESQRLLEQEREKASLDAELLVRGERPVGRGLHELADQVCADLLVVGSTSHALLGRVRMGDDARAAFNGAPCAIAIAPRGYTETQHDLRKLGVGYDGSAQSVRALTVALELASRCGAEVKALWVVTLESVRDERPIPADWPQTAELLVGRCLDQLGRLEGVDGDSVYGGPRDELSRLSDRVDLLIVGSRGYGPLGRLFHGSISSYLVGHTACPLLVLPRGASQQAESDGAERDR
jgi:nucleotide-binding universal stress UspA family protein